MVSRRRSASLSDDAETSCAIAAAARNPPARATARESVEVVADRASPLFAYPHKLFRIGTDYRTKRCGRI